MRVAASRATSTLYSTEEAFEMIVGSLYRPVHRSGGMSFDLLHRFDEEFLASCLFRVGDLE